MWLGSIGVQTVQRGSGIILCTCKGGAMVCIGRRRTLAKGSAGFQIMSRDIELGLCLMPKISQMS